MKAGIRIGLIVFILLFASMNFHLIVHHNSCRLVKRNAIASNPRQSRDFKIISYNVNDMPTAIFTNKRNRISRLTSFLNENKDSVDMFMFQEVFTDFYRLKLIQFFKQLDWSVVYGDPSANYWTFVHNGLFVASRYPFAHTEAINFRSCVMFDCFSKKGALLVQVKKNKALYTIVNTHLQDSTFDINGATRSHQLKEIHEMGQKYETITVIGDINTTPSRLRDAAPYTYGIRLFGRAVFPALPTFQKLTYDGAFGPLVTSVSTLEPTSSISDHRPILVTLN